AKKFGLYSIAGLRRPKKATGGTLPSYHCFGLAVDINYKGNPFVGRADKQGAALEEIVKRATLVMEGQAEALRTNAADDPGMQWERLYRQSDALRNYLALDNASLAQKVGSGLDGHDIAWWQDQQSKDRAAAKVNSELKGHGGGALGFMDLSKDLV